MIEIKSNLIFVLLLCLLINHPLHASSSSSTIILEFSEGEGDLIFDTQGLINGSLTDTVWVPGYNGTGLYFNGESSNLRFEDTDILDPNDNLLISMWFNATSYIGNGGTSGSPLIAKWQTGSIGQYHLTTYDGGIIFRIADGERVSSVQFRQSLLTNVWYHIVAVWYEDSLALYLNGTEVSYSETSMEKLYEEDYNEDYVQIGHDTGGGAPYWYFHGIIDEVKLFMNMGDFLNLSAVLEGKYPFLESSISDFRNPTTFSSAETEVSTTANNTNTLTINFNYFPVIFALALVPLFRRVFSLRRCRMD